MYQHFKYINPIRDENGKLRDWKDYDKITKNENRINDNQYINVSVNHKYYDYKSRMLDAKRK